jgi:pimeloyl-ACP methyl ester carboxylesterase
MKSENWIREDLPPADIPLWREAGFGADLVALHISRVFYGMGQPRGDGSGVILLPGFLMPDFYLVEMRGWLRRLGYQPQFSGIRVNADCPNLLIRNYINPTIDQSLKETGRKVHLVGHSLGGIIARSIAAQRPQDVASVITLGSPFRGAAAHRGVLMAADAVRWRVLRKRDGDVLPECYTGRCGCEFVNALGHDLPASILQTAIYTRRDGIVDWQYCVTDNPEVDCEVSGTHIGMAFNPEVYRIVAERLAKASESGK